MKLSVINNSSDVWYDILGYVLQVKSCKCDNKETLSWYGGKINLFMALQNIKC